MATLTRHKSSSEKALDYSQDDLASGVPKPFPTPAEREQEELLDTLADEELHLHDGGVPTHEVVEADPLKHLSVDLIPPRLGQVQSTCVTALQDLLVSSRMSPDRRHSMPSDSPPTYGLHRLINDLRMQVAERSTLEQTNLLSGDELLAELRVHVGRIVGQLSSREAELALTLVSLLAHLHRLAPLRADNHTSLLDAIDSDPYSTLQRHLSDFQLERSSTPEEMKRGATPVQAVEAALIWSEVDAELDAVLSLCRSHTTFDPFADYLPPEYDAADHELPQYEPADEDLHHDSKSSYTAGSHPNGVASHGSETVNEKMKMDLEAVTVAIERLYSVAPQLHDQRVELKKKKVEQMERAKQKGKQRAKNGDKDTRDLDKMLELINKASTRKLNDQAVFIDDYMMRKMELSKQKAQEKRAAFVEQLVNHSEARRMHSQDAAFLQPSHRSRSQPALVDNIQDPFALLSLPEFIREGIPDVVQHRMQLERDPEALLSLPEFMMEHPLPHSELEESTPEVHATPGPSRPKGTRSRSLSEPLAWLLSAKPSSSSGSGLSLKRRSSKRQMRPGSSGGRIPIVEETLDVTYVAEYHENLQHVFVFLDVSGLRAGFNLEAEVVPHGNAGPGHLILKCDFTTSQPLALPAQVSPGPAAVTVVGGRHYQIKLPMAKSVKSESPSGELPPSEYRELLDSTYFQAVKPTAFICSSCSLPLVRASRLNRYRDLPSEHWAELVDAWMCHADQKLHEHVQKGSKEGFWPVEGEALVGGSYVLVREDVIVRVNLNDVEVHGKSTIDDWYRIRCICGAIVGRCRQHNSSEGSVLVYRLAKYAFRPVSPTTEPSRVPLSAFIVEDLTEYVHAHATYRFIIMDEEQERPRIMAWLFKPNMRIAYAMPNPYVIAKSGSMRVAKVLFKIVGPSVGSDDWQSLLNKHPGFPQAEHLYYPLEICRRLAALLKESNTAYPEGMRTMAGLDVGWLQRV